MPGVVLVPRGRLLFGHVAIPARAGREVAMDGAVRELLAPLLAARPRPGGWRMLSWDGEQGICVTLTRGDTAVLIELEARNPDRACYARTARFNLTARRVNAADPALSVDARRAVDQLVDLVRAREAGLPDFERPTTSRRTAVREIEVDRVLVAEGANQYYVNPYVGCMIGCSFCYVAERADFSRRLAGLPYLPWGRYVDVKVNAAEILRAEVATHPPGPVRLSPIVTDPYQPIEHHYRITRACLEVLRERGGFAPVILTRAARVLEDVELLAGIPRAAVGLSIPTDDDRVRHQIEPGADPIADRIDTLAALRAAGVTTFAVIQPVMPMNPARLVDALAPHVDCVRIDRMYQCEQARPLYRSAGREDALSDEFFATTIAELERELARAGVAVDDLDDLERLVAAGATGL